MKGAALTLIILAMGGFLFAWSGLYDVGARSGHWPITAWLLHFALRNSVQTHALPVEVPPLDHPALVFKGLGHYAGGCAPCHGEPGRPPGPIASHLLPEPPYLPDEIRRWSAGQLFWIVRNGLKYTGMPAWPGAGRDDEVWAVVAGLLRLPELSEADYRRLSRGGITGDPAETARLIVAAGPVGESLVACARCHGLAGGGGGAGAFPRLSGQSEIYLFEAMQAYALGTRPSGIMQPIAAALAEDDRRKLAAFYARAEAPPPSPPAAASDLLRRGAAIAALGVPERRVAPCASCHDGPARLPLYPSLSGQFAAYLVEQLRLWRGGQRGGSAAAVMEAAVHGLTDEQSVAVSAWYAAQPPERR